MPWLLPRCRTGKKWRETKQQPSRARSGHQISCCLVSLHFLCDILATIRVHVFAFMRTLNEAILQKLSFEVKRIKDDRREGTWVPPSLLRFPFVAPTIADEQFFCRGHPRWIGWVFFFLARWLFRQPNHKLSTADIMTQWQWQKQRSWAVLNYGWREREGRKTTITQWVWLLRDG